MAHGVVGGHVWERVCVNSSLLNYRGEGTSCVLCMTC